MADGKILDVVIVGAGPAGVSCAVWLARLGFRPVLLEARDRVGGLCCDHPFSDGWNATLPEMTGPEVARNLARSLELAQVETHLSTPVGRIEPAGGATAVPFSLWRVCTTGEDPPPVGRPGVLGPGLRARCPPRRAADPGL